MRQLRRNVFILRGKGGPSEGRILAKEFSMRGAVSSFPLLIRPGVARCNTKQSRVACKLTRGLRVSIEFTNAGGITTRVGNIPAECGRALPGGGGYNDVSHYNYYNTISD